MAVITLVGPAVMGALLLAVLVALARGIDWRSNEIFAPSETDDLAGSALGSPVTWVLVFLAMALGTTGLALGAVGGLGLTLPGGVALALAPFALLLLAYLVVGTYAAVRERDVSPAGATMAAAVVVAALFLVAIGGHLLMGP